MNSFEIIAYPLLPIAAMELLLGYLLLIQQPRGNPLHRSVVAMAFFSSAYALNTAVMYLMASRGRDFMFFARLNWIGWLSIPAGLQFLYYLRSETVRIARMVGYIFYPLWVGILMLCLFTDLIVSPGYSLIPYVNRPGPLEIPARLGGAFMLLWLLVEILRTRRHLTGIKKFQLHYFFLGVSIAAFTSGAIAGIMPAVGGAGVEPGLGSYFTLPWVALTFYAIVRHSLFEMRTILSRTLSIFIVIFVCAGIQAILLSEIEPALGTALSSFISLSLLGFFLFGTPASRKVQSFINDLIVGSRYNYAALMRDALVKLNAKQEEHELFEVLIDTACVGLGVRDAGIYFHRIEDGYVMRKGRGLFSDMVDQRSLSDIAVNKLQETNQSLVRTMSGGAKEDGQTALLTTYLRGIGARALVPLLFQGRLQGALVLGPKARGELFGQRDVGFLESLAAHAASALENARLNDIARKVRLSLRESEERFLTLAQRIPAAVFIHRGAAIVYANYAAEEMTGFTRAQLMTMHVRDIIHPEYQNAIQPDGLEKVGTQVRDTEKEVRVIQQDGGERWAVMTSAVIEYAEQPAVIWILFDLTEHKRSEGKLRYERMRDAVGRMASYLSSDLDRMVRDIRQIAELREIGEHDGQHSEETRKILSTVEQAEILVRLLKEFSARQPTKRSLQDINDLVEKREKILLAILSGKCELVVRPSPEPLKVMADPIKLENALMNLVLNAREQMPLGGIVTVAIVRAVIDADFIRRNGYGRVGAYACISVCDTGEGMDKDEQERIFEPFFTTREEWKGKGIGLSMVYDIVKDHEGYITVSSKPGQGSCYMTHLPLVL